MGAGIAVALAGPVFAYLRPPAVPASVDVPAVQGFIIQEEDDVPLGYCYAIERSPAGLTCYRELP